MARRTKKVVPSKPMTAAERRRRDFEAYGLQADAASLSAHSNVEVDRATQTNVQRARRVDVFDALKSGMETGAYDCCRRLEKDLAIQHGETGSPKLVRVDNGRDVDQLDLMVEAGKRVKAVLRLVGLRDAWLLRELCRPSDDMRLKCETWRKVVAHITGEENPVAQCTAVRAAAANLKMAYEEIDRRPRVAHDVAA